MPSAESLEPNWAHLGAGTPCDMCPAQQSPGIIRVSPSPAQVPRAPPTRSALSKGRPTSGLPAHVPGQDSRGRDAFHWPSSLISHDPPGSSPPPNAEPRPMSECTSLAPTSNPGQTLPRGPSPPSRLPLFCRLPGLCRPSDALSDPSSVPLQSLPPPASVSASTPRAGSLSHLSGMYLASYTLQCMKSTIKLPHHPTWQPRQSLRQSFKILNIEVHP